MPLSQSLPAQAGSDWSAHALALGLEHFVSIESGLVEALEEANDQEAVVVAAHPYADHDRSPLRPTRRIWRERESFRGLIHRYELFNRRETFACRTTGAPDDGSRQLPAVVAPLPRPPSLALPGLSDAVCRGRPAGRAGRCLIQDRHRSVTHTRTAVRKDDMWLALRRLC